MTLDAVLSPYVGIVTDLEEILPVGGDAWLFHSVALAPTDGAEPISGGGYSSSADRAVQAALAEALERYAAACVPEERLVHGSAVELPGAAPPESFALFAPEQHAQHGFPFVPFTRETRLRWVDAVRLPSGEPARLPAQLVYMGRPRPRNEPLIGYATSNGLACATTFAAAVLGGLLELVERDAFMITWNARLSLPRLDVSRHPELRDWEAHVLAPTGLRHAVVDLSLFHDVPAALAVVRAEGRSRGELGVGAAAAATIEEAWRKALCEAYAVRGATQVLAAAGEISPERVETFSDHIRLYVDAGAAAATRFLDAATTLRDVREVRPIAGDGLEAIAAVCERLAARGVDVYCADVTSVDVREAGLRVAKTVAPQLCSLDARHDARFLGGSRLYEIPCTLGLRDRALRFDELNPNPHPFP